MNGKVLSWFSAENGKKFAMAAVCSVGFGCASIHFLPNTYFLNKYKEIVQMYRYGQPVPISKEIMKRFSQVLEDMKINDMEMKLIKPFIVYGLEAFHAGSTFTRTGAIIGLPTTFYYSSSNDVDTEHITVLNKPVSWNSEAGKSFKEALVLSEDGQKFLIGREISYVQTPYVYLYSVYPLATVLFVYTCAHVTNQKLRLLERPPVLRGILYTILAFFGFGLWSFMNDYTTVTLEIKADKNVCSLGENYVKGGLEVYSKIQQRNIALRELMGSKGPNVYSVSGNEIYFLRQKHMPVVHRKLYLEKQMKVDT